MSKIPLAFSSTLVILCTFSCTDCRPFSCAGFSRGSCQCQKLPASTGNRYHNMAAKLRSDNYPIPCLAPQPLGNSSLAACPHHADRMGCTLRQCTSNDYSYQCDLPSSKCSAITLDSLISQYFQAMQRVADSWRSPIGSSAIMILIAFFKADPEPYPTNEERQEWAA